MDTEPLADTIAALEDATHALLVALGHKPDIDLEAATAALRARDAALRLLAINDVESRPPEVKARLRRVLEQDVMAADRLRAEMESLRTRMATGRQVLSVYGPSSSSAPARPGRTGSRKIVG